MVSEIYSCLQRQDFSLCKSLHTNYVNVNILSRHILTIVIVGYCSTVILNVHAHSCDII